MLCRTQPAAHGRSITVYREGSWIRQSRSDDPVRCQDCAEIVDGNIFHLCDNHFVCGTCKVERDFDVTQICERDAEGDLLPRTDKVPRVLGGIVKHLPPPAEYVKMLNHIVTHHLCAHSDESPCSKGHRGHGEEPQCSNGVRSDLLAEADEFVLYLRLAHMCGGMRTVDKLECIMRTVGIHFGTDFHLGDVYSNDPAKRQWATAMISCMQDVATHLVRKGIDPTEWLRTFRLYQQDRHFYVHLVRDYIMVTFE